MMQFMLANIVVSTEHILNFCMLAVSRARIPYCNQTFATYDGEFDLQWVCCENFSSKWSKQCVECFICKNSICSDHGNPLWNDVSSVIWVWEWSKTDRTSTWESKKSREKIDSSTWTSWRSVDQVREIVKKSSKNRQKIDLRSKSSKKREQIFKIVKQSWTNREQMLK